MQERQPILESRVEWGCQAAAVRQQPQEVLKVTRQLLQGGPVCGNTQPASHSVLHASDTTNT